MIQERLGRLVVDNQLAVVNIISQEDQPTIACGGASNPVFDHCFEVTPRGYFLNVAI